MFDKLKDTIEKVDKDKDFESGYFELRELINNLPDVYVSDFTRTHT